MQILIRIVLSVLMNLVISKATKKLQSMEKSQSVGDASPGQFKDRGGSYWPRFQKLVWAWKILNEWKGAV